MVKSRVYVAPRVRSSMASFADTSGKKYSFVIYT